MVGKLEGAVLGRGGLVVWRGGIPGGGASHSPYPFPSEIDQTASVPAVAGPDRRARLESGVGTTSDAVATDTSAPCHHGHGLPGEGFLMWVWARAYPGFFP